jgi:hypothetical protein
MKPMLLQIDVLRHIQDMFIEVYVVMRLYDSNETMNAVRVKFKQIAIVRTSSDLLETSRLFCLQHCNFGFLVLHFLQIVSGIFV